MHAYEGACAGKRPGVHVEAYTVRVHGTAAPNALSLPPSVGLPLQLDVRERRACAAALRASSARRARLPPFPPLRAPASSLLLSLSRALSLPSAPSPSPL